MKRFFFACPCILLMVMYLLGFGLIYSEGSSLTTSNLNPTPPAQPVRLIFIHHSTGENWLADENGGLGIALRDNNYFVSDTNYGWGPAYTDGTSTIGDHTDIGNWWEWFRGPNSSTYLNALYNEGDQHSSYSRLSTAPPGGNEIIMFKSCFPNSAFQGNPSDPVPSIDDNPLRGEGSGSEYHTVANAKGIYIDLLEYFRTHTDKLFIVITAPPLMESDTSASQAANARAFNNWLVNEWLTGYPYKNVAVFDFYNVLTSNGGNANTNDLDQESGNHHRWWNGTIQHIQTVNDDMAAYPTGDSHPSEAGNLKATGEFLSLLNVAYNRWKGASTSSNPCDFNGDGKTDVAAFHLPSDQFFTDYAGNLGQFGWGGSDSMPLIWDYDGDGKTDVSIYHIPTNQWFVKGAGDNLGQFGWGGADSVPVPGDYNGDGHMERAFYHSPTNQWFVEGQAPVTFGWNGAECIPVPGDYDGDGKTDMVIYHIPSNQWFQYGVGNLGQFGWGGADCIPVPGDYNGDGKTEIAVYHVPTNQWFVKGIGNLGQYGWGGLESFPIPGDYNGDGVMERGFYRPGSNQWFIEGESDFVWGWGGSEFMPITSHIAVYNWFRFKLHKFE